MAGNRTFTMIKPHCFQNNQSGAILKMINDAGFRLKAMKLTQLNADQAKAFYAVHKDKYFFGPLVEFMCSGPIIAAVLEKDDAVQDFRKLIGSTNPEEAEEGTIRKIFAISQRENAVHGSDSDENAELEASFFFSKMEIFE